MISYLQEILEEGYKNLNIEEKPNVVLSNRPELCDYQCDDAFKLAKKYHKNPVEIGQAIVFEVRKNHADLFKEISVVKPGFINFTLSDFMINKFLKNMMQSEKFAIPMPEKQDLYFLDYGGPNIAKPLHVGHMRTAIVGESIKRILNFMGQETIADVHLGDYGLQIGQVIYGILQDGKKVEDLTLEYLEETYPKISALCKENEEVKKKCEEITKELQEGNPKYQEYFKVIREISGNDIKRLYQYLNVSFDLWEGESDAYAYIPKTEELFKDVIIESEGAKVIPVGEDLPPLIFQKSNGAYLYATTDLATIYERVTKYHPDHILYIVDNRQSLHFKQVFRAVSQIGFMKMEQLEFLGYGTVNGTDGKPYKTRSGDAPKLDSLFQNTLDLFLSKKEENKKMEKEDQDKIVNSILKFADLQNNREKDYIFDIQKFSSVVGKTGPYILYTYVRIQKILEKETLKELSETIYNEEDRNLRLKVLELPIYITKAYEERMPSYIAEYVYQLCTVANAFYQKNHIQNLEEEEKRNSWVYLLTLTNKILKEMLFLIGITIPKFM